MHLSLVSILALAPAVIAVVVDAPTIKSRRTWDVSWRLDTPKIGLTLTRDFKTFDWIDLVDAEPEKATVRLPKDVNLQPGDIWLVAWTSHGTGPIGYSEKFTIK
ncbi:unnamed protein product [Penicillium bialowiezense]